jgi:predicted ATPase
VSGLLPTGLPAPATALVGRERELGDLRRQLVEDGARLVTLTGTGGVGKTRLAIAVATALRDRFPDGAAFVALASVADPAHIWSTVAQALGVSTSRQPPLEAVQGFLTEQRALLVLDNFEHLLAAAGDVAALVAACPRLALLVTIRAPLRVSGERPFLVSPLPLPALTPAPNAASSRASPPPEPSLPAAAGPFTVLPSDVLASDAVRLLVARARDAAPAFQLTADNAATVAALCRRLEGLPLAIELAAARLRLLSPAALLARLDTRLPVLTTGPRDAPTRQRTLRDTIAWSYDLLPPAAQTLFRRLAVFSGGFTLDAAEALYDAPPTDSLDALDALVESSLVQRLAPLEGEDDLAQQAEPAAGAPVEGEPRFTMLETIREYAQEQLETAGEGEATRQRHASFYAALVEQAAPDMHGPRQIEWYDRFEQEHANLQITLRWIVGHDEAALGVRLVEVLRWYWEVRGHLQEGSGWLAALLALPALAHHPTQHVRAFGIAADMARSAQGNHRMANTLSGESVSLARALGDPRALAEALLWHGVAAFRWKLAENGRIALEESLALWRTLDEPWGTAQALEFLGLVTRDGGDPAGAFPLYETALTLRQQMGDWRGLAQTLQSLGNTALHQQDYALARRYSEQSLAIARRLRDRQRIVVSLHGL